MKTVWQLIQELAKAKPDAHVWVGTQKLCSPVTAISVEDEGIGPEGVFIETTATEHGVTG